MASISIAGKVVCKEGSAPVSLKTFDNGNQIANFSVVDNEYFYVKEGDDRPGQFYSVEVNGKAAEIFADRLQRGDRVAVHGQLVQRVYQDKTYLTVKSARVTSLEPRRDEAAAPASSGTRAARTSRVREEDVPF
jgi:single-stranded DNA-binding protein